MRCENVEYLLLYHIGNNTTLRPGRVMHSILRWCIYCTIAVWWI